MDKLTEQAVVSSILNILAKPELKVVLAEELYIDDPEDSKLEQILNEHTVSKEDSREDLEKEYSDPTEG